MSIKAAKILKACDLRDYEIARFWSKVDQRSEDECWPWLGSRDKDGYGSFAIRRGVKVNLKLKAHRMSYALKHGEIPAGLYGLHRCDHPWCVNPGHIFLGTLADNNADMHQKNRARGGDRKLTAEEVADIRRQYVPGKAARHALGLKFGISAQHVWRLAKRLQWKRLPQSPDDIAKEQADREAA